MEVKRSPEAPLGRRGSPEAARDNCLEIPLEMSRRKLEVLRLLIAGEAMGLDPVEFSFRGGTTGLTGGLSPQGARAW